MRIFGLIFTFSCSVVLVSLRPGFEVAVNGQVSPCFLINSSRQMIYLPASMCGSKPETSANQTTNVGLTPADKAFIEEYQNLADSKQEPVLRSILSRTIENSPTNEINEAKSICGSLRGGRSLKEIIQAKVKELGTDTTSAASRANIELITFRGTLAIKHYCPEFLGQLSSLN
jgi:hypothetical protein